MKASWLEGVRGVVSGFGGSGVVWLRLVLVLKPLLVAGAMIALAGVVTWLGHTITKAGALEAEIELRDAWFEEAQVQSEKVRARVEAAREVAENVTEETMARLAIEKDKRMRAVALLRQEKVPVEEACGCTLDSPLPEVPEGLL